MGHRTHHRLVRGLPPPGHSLRALDTDVSRLLSIRCGAHRAAEVMKPVLGNLNRMNARVVAPTLSATDQSPHATLIGHENCFRRNSELSGKLDHRPISICTERRRVRDLYSGSRPSRHRQSDERQAERPCQVERVVRIPRRDGNQGGGFPVVEDGQSRRGV